MSGPPLTSGRFYMWFALASCGVAIALAAGAMFALSGDGAYRDASPSLIGAFILGACVMVQSSRTAYRTGALIGVLCAVLSFIFVAVRGADVRNAETFAASALATDAIRSAASSLRTSWMLVIFSTVALVLAVVMAGVRLYQNRLVSGGYRGAFGGDDPSSGSLVSRSLAPGRFP